MTQLPLTDFTLEKKTLSNHHYPLAQSLEPYRHLIEQHETTFIELVPQVLNTHRSGKHSILDSKIGGLPYLKEIYDYPLDREGKMMKLVAQINFNWLHDLGLIDKHSIFPHQGLLQFFIPAKFPWGGTLEQDSAVIYHENTSEASVSNEEIALISHNYEEFPVSEEHAFLSATLFKEYCGLTNREFDRVFGDIDLTDEIFDGFNQFSNGGCKIGGYPDVVDTDDVRPENADILLLQIDSTANGSICWGDAGVAQFFIPREALIKKDFNQAFFTWNCS